MDLFIGFIMVLPFGWSQFQSVNWTLVPMDICWKIGFVVVFFRLSDVFVEFAFDERIKTNHSCYFLFI
jgi:hypothetical protein